MEAGMEAWRTGTAALAAAVGADGNWRYICAYEDEAAPQLLGFRALHSSGAALDVLWMPVVPQCLMYANTPLAGDCGAVLLCRIVHVKFIDIIACSFYYHI